MSNYEYINFIIDEEHAGSRADRVLSELFEEVSRSYIQKLIEDGCMSIDGKVCLVKKTVFSAGSLVELRLPPAKTCDAVPEDIPLDIVYEDDELLVVNKPKGMVVHPAAGNLSGTLVNALLYHCGSLSVINGTQRPGIVHRIDKDTSGLLVIAKTDAAHRGLSEQFAVHSIKRIYSGVCFYGLSEDEFTIDAPLGRDPKNRLKMAEVPDGRRAVTHIRIKERFSGFTEFYAQLETGRTHQIRVHMAAMQRPLLGDKVYGPEKQPYKLSGQMLHAGLLGFVHPVLGTYMEFTADPPAEYRDTIAKLRERK